MFKLCKYLMTITGDARYGDWIERLVYNGIAATIPMSPDGQVFYYSDYNALGGAKRNHSVGWSCCTGTRPMALADLHDLVYFHGADDLYVNLFVPSTVVWDRPRRTGHGPPADAVPGGRIDRADCRICAAVDVRGEAARARLAGRPDGRHRQWSTCRRGRRRARLGQPCAGEWRDGDRVAVRPADEVRQARPLDPSAPLSGGHPARAGGSGGPIGGQQPGELLRRTGDLERVLVPSDGEPLTYHA